MIYAEIIATKSKNSDFTIYGLEFFWTDSYLKELLPWQDHLALIINDKAFESSFSQDWTELINRRISLNYLANKGYIPCGDNLFYKKSFLEKFF